MEGDEAVPVHNLLLWYYFLFLWYVKDGEDAYKTTQNT